MPDTKRTATGVLGGLAGLVGLSAIAGILVTVTVTPALAITGAAASSAITLFDNMPRILEIEKLMLPTTLYYKNTDGKDAVLTKFYDQNRSPVNFDQIAPVMYDAILSSEDPRFYQHGGIDLIGTTRALLSNVQGGQTQGGSSISQQYVKNILTQRCYSTAKTPADVTTCYDQVTNSSGTDGIQRKLQEMRYSIQLEQQYSKNDILLGYLNIANFGGTTYGIDAASRYYFGVPAAQLSLGQAAALAGMVQNPNTYRLDQPASATNGAPNGVVEANDTQLAGLVSLRNAGTITPEQFLAAADGYGDTKGRQLYVLSRLLADGKITQDQYVAAAIEPITPKITPSTTGCASTGGMAYFCQLVVSVIASDPAFGATIDDRQIALKRGGLNIYTTLDARLQSAAEGAIAQYTPASVGSDSWKYGATITN
ncbi:MAG: transglycosylase domain-containing protein, partial [Actinobacteria bacterium]|nr:transglycosylase domain-containing protein [Actinomycetota bacterium]